MMATYNPVPLVRKRHKLSKRKKKKLANNIIKYKDLRETAMVGAIRMGRYDLFFDLHTKGETLKIKT